MKKVQKVYNPQKDEDLEILNFVLENAQEDTYGFVVNAQLGKMIFLQQLQLRFPYPLPLQR